MRFIKSKFICSLLALTALLFTGNVFGAVPELPDGLIMADVFKSGFGTPVGKIRMVQGKVIIIHDNILKGYWAKRGLPLYRGDTIITQKKSRISFKLNDKSIISLSSNTKLVINKSIYNKKEKRRSSFLGLSLGKARFFVTKLLRFKRSEFRVKTVTAVCGVRGSDFVMLATDKLTEVTALENTELEVISLAAPEAPPMIITDFQRTGVVLGELPYEPEMVPPEEIEDLKKEFSTIPPTGVSAVESAVDISAGEEIATDVTETKASESAAEMAVAGEPEKGLAPGSIKRDLAAKETAEDEGMVDTKIVNFPVDILVEPEDIEVQELEEPFALDVIEGEGTSQLEEEILVLHDEIKASDTAEYGYIGGSW